MADSHMKSKEFPLKRLSITSSRQKTVNKQGNSDVKLIDLKSLYDSQFRKSSDLPNVQQNISKLSISKSKHKSNVGFDISFTIPIESETVLHQKAQNYESKEFKLPNNISKYALEKSLNEKNGVYDSYSTTDYSAKHSQKSDTEEDKNGICIFQGEITTFKNAHYDAMDSIMPKEKLAAQSSLHVIQSTMVQSLEDLWTWPWINSGRNVWQLYRHTSTTASKSSFEYTKELPRLECPNPEHTFKRYMESVKPFVCPLQFEITKDKVGRFMLHESERLQNYFLVSDKSEENWIHKILHNYDYCYFQAGSHLINTAIIAPFCHDIWPEKPDSMLQRAVVIIRLATEFWDLIRTETLRPVQNENGEMIEMRQFLYLFSSTTLPGIPKTSICRLMKTESEGETARHIIVAYRGSMFVMDVADEDYHPLRLMDIKDSLKVLKNFVDSVRMGPYNGVNLLTASTNVGTWYEERHRLSQIDNNEDYFSEIDHALFILSLDHMNVHGLDQLANEAIFADGCNRWYDKGLNFYIHNNGYVTLNMNNKLLDGSTVGFLLNYIHLRIMDENDTWDDEIITKSTLSLSRFIKKESGAFSRSTTPENPRRKSLVTTDLKMLDFSLDLTSHEKISDCANVFNSLSSGVLTSVCKIDDFDNLFFSKTTINKDVFALLVIHLTFFRMYYRPASMGSKFSIKRFANTRYDILRSATVEVMQWCKAYLDRDADLETKNTLLWVAYDKLVELLKECINGKGYDNHLNAMRNLSVTVGIPHENNVFEDEGFFLSGGGDRYEILTETIGVGCTSCPVLLPCNPKGYGVGYSVANGFILFTVTSWKEENISCAPLFAATLNKTCREIIASPPAKSQ